MSQSLIINDAALHINTNNMAVSKSLAKSTNLEAFHHSTSIFSITRHLSSDQPIDHSSKIFGDRQETALSEESDQPQNIPVQTSEGGSSFPESSQPGELSPYPVSEIWPTSEYSERVTQLWLQLMGNQKMPNSVSAHTCPVPLIPSRSSRVSIAERPECNSPSKDPAKSQANRQTPEQSQKKPRQLVVSVEVDNSTRKASMSRSEKLANCNSSKQLMLMDSCLRVAAFPLEGKLVGHILKSVPGSSRRQFLIDNLWSGLLDNADPATVDATRKFILSTHESNLTLGGFYALCLWRCGVPKVNTALMTPVTVRSSTKKGYILCCPFCLIGWRPKYCTKLVFDLKLCPTLMITHRQLMHNTVYSKFLTSEHIPTEIVIAEMFRVLAESTGIAKGRATK